MRLGKKLRKNGIAIDVILLGQSEGEIYEKLKKFVDTVNNGDNSHYLALPGGM